MPLSNKDLSDISKEFAVANGDLTNDKNAIPNIQDQVTAKEEQKNRIYILYNDAHVERITPYETEHRWINGTTCSTITQGQIETFGADGRATYFYPVSWTKANPQIQANVNGNPKSSSTDSESSVLNDSIASNGLISQINLLQNGITGSNATTITQNPLHNIPAGTVSNLQLDVQSTVGFSAGQMIYINSGTSSGLYSLDSVTSQHLFISSVIPSQIGFSTVGATIKNTVAGFTNSERQTLTSSLYQELLINLTNRIKARAPFWEAALNNQLAQLNINIDQPAQITAAKNSVNSAKTIYSNWFALSDTGVNGKFVNTSLTNLASGYNARNAGFTSRMSQITAALGSATQDAEGVASGNGLYLQRFKCLGFLINTANGPLYQINGLKAAKTNFEDKVKSTTDKLATFSNLVRYGACTKDPVGHSLEIDGVSQFAVSDAVVLTANDLAAIECTITAISGKLVTLSATIPKEYNKASKAGIIKRV